MIIRSRNVYSNALVKTSEIHVAVSMAHVPRSATSLVDLEPVKRQQHGCRVGYQVRAAYRSFSVT